MKKDTYRQTNDSGIADAQRQDAIARASAGLPFYLNLAIDSWNRSGGVTTPSVVSRDDILRRFLQHVGDAEARALELLAVCRLFDYEIFQVVVRAFGLPHDRLTWESLCAYSFVYPTQNEQYRLHELMRENLQVRLPEAVRAEINTLLHETWRGRAATFGAASEDIASAQALREQVYHGLHAKLITGEQILAMADSAFDLGGRATTAGILGDLQRYLSGHGYAPGDLAEAAVCLEAEMTMRLSAAPQTLQVVTGTSPDVRTVVGARLATAAANAYRTLGDTGRAQNLYRWVWQEHQTQARDAAGIWYADLEMCQGRFPKPLTLHHTSFRTPTPRISTLLAMYIGYFI